VTLIDGIRWETSFLLCNAPLGEFLDERTLCRIRGTLEVVAVPLIKLRRYLQTLAIEDWRILLKLGIWKLAHPLFNVYYVFEIDPRKVLISPKRLPAGIAVRLFRGEEIGSVAAKLTEAGIPMAAVEQRIKRGDLVALAFAGEEVAAYGWTTFKDASVPEVGATLPLHPDEAVQFNSLVMPYWRGSGLADAITAPALRYLAEHGCRRILSWIHALNTRMIKTVLRQGKHQVATIVSCPLLHHPPAQPFTRKPPSRSKEEIPGGAQPRRSSAGRFSFRRPPGSCDGADALLRARAPEFEAET
jgi:hypothetical protein